jgi:hypothetical protein
MGPFIGIIVQPTGDALPVAHVHFVENQFQGGGTQVHVQVNTAAEGVRFVGNVFTGGSGLSLGLPEGASSRDLIVASNTFFRCDTWLRRRSSPEIAGVLISTI